ncbi:hypothetical protein PMIT1323_02497 [Prochlorococcus marinus str. MIT 1323]|nr:hypothetical protein PMIT1323_02497 [Prochlorococcus marinus str. MIT 1323]
MYASLHHSDNIAPGGIAESSIQERFKLALLTYNFHFIGLPLR